MITPATPSDAAETIALWHACTLTRPWNNPQADFTLALETPTSDILLARSGTSVIGSVMVGFDGHRGWVYYLAVHPDCQRQGIGRALMVAAEQWLRDQGAPKIQLMVRGDNDVARGFYAALGYDLQNVATYGKRLDF
jgi:ribosomal protein S18 acetylase RimI-like enzyme